MTLEATDEVPPWPRAGELGDKALGCVFEAFKRMPDVFILALCVYLAAEAIGGSLNDRVGLFGSSLHDSFAAQAPGVRFVTLIGLSLFELMIMACVAVAVHRFILLREMTGGFAPLGHRYAWKFGAWLFGVGALEIIAIQPLPLVLRLLALVPIAIIDLRTSLLFPAVAVGAAGGGLVERLSTSWRRTHGRVLSLLYATIVTILPLFGIVVVFMLLELLSFALSDWPDSLRGSAISGLISLLLGSISHVYGTMCGAAVASLAYRAALDAEARRDGAG